MLHRLSCFRVVSNFRSFSRNAFYGVRFQLHVQPPTWRTRLSLFVWAITFDLSGIGGPTNSDASASIARRVIWPHKTCRYVKVGIRLGGFPCLINRSKAPTRVETQRPRYQTCNATCKKSGCFGFLAVEFFSLPQIAFWSRWNFVAFRGSVLCHTFKSLWRSFSEVQILLLFPARLVCARPYESWIWWPMRVSSLKPLLACVVRDVSGSTLDRQTDSPQVFPWCHYFMKIPEKYLKLGHVSFLTYPFQFIIHCLQIIWRYVL